MPARSRTSENNITTAYTSVYNGTVTNGTSVSTLSNESMTGFDTVNFHSKKRRGELLPLTPFTHQKMHATSTAGSYHVFKTGADYTGYGGHRATPFPGWDIDVAELQAIMNQHNADPMVTAAAAKIYGHGHDSLTFLAELHKVARMFRNLIPNLKALLAKKPGSLYQSWLEYRYGWRLLYYDIVEIQKALANLDGERRRFSQTCGMNVASDSIVDDGYQQWSTSYHSWSYKTDYTVSVRGTVVADISPPKFRFNPLTTAWELVRFSFVIDWFIDVGSWLESMSFLTLQQNYVAAGGLKIEATRTCVNYDYGFRNGYSGYFNDPTSYASAEASVRSPQSVPNVPLLNVRLDIPKFLDLWALLAGARNPLGRG